MPHLVDQPFWADRLHRLGVGPQPLPLHELTVDTLAGAIRSCLSRPTYRRRAGELARRIATEDGAGAMLSLVSRFENEVDR